MKADGYSVVAWNRDEVAPLDQAAARDFFEQVRPDLVVHCATGPAEWAAQIAGLARSVGVGFIYTSSVSVFGGSQTGPFSVADVPEPEDDYGKYKLECERSIAIENSDAIIVRIGWQIGFSHGGNHMLDHLYRVAEQNGVIHASTNWYQSCSFLDDTATGISSLIAGPAGLYHLNSNTTLNFYDLVSRLRKYVNADWVVEPSESPVCNNIMLDNRVVIPAFNARLDGTSLQ